MLSWIQNLAPELPLSLILILSAVLSSGEAVTQELMDMALRTPAIFLSLLQGQWPLPPCFPAHWYSSFLCPDGTCEAPDGLLQLRTTAYPAWWL